MTNIPTITIVLVTLAAALICFREIRAIGTNAVKNLVNRHLNMLGKLHESAGEEINESFDFWWSNGPADVVTEGIKRTIQIPDEMRHQLEGGLAHMDVSPGVAECREKAFHLALHARINSEEKNALSMMPRIYGIRARAIEARASHEKDLEADRLQLVELGLDVEEMEKYFASST